MSAEHSSRHANQRHASHQRAVTSAGATTRFAAAFLAATSLAMCCQVLADEPIAAVWKVREVDFLYRSTTALYPCHELQNRVANILLAVGAREDIEVKATDCEQFFMPQEESHFDPFERSSSDPFERADRFQRRNDQFGNTRSERRQSARVRIRMMTPVAMTPEVMAEINKDKSRRELISRVTGNPAAALNDPVVFAAQRQSVTLSQRSLRLGPEDCELLDQMASSVLRELDVRVVRGNFRCDPRHASRISPQLTVEALVPTGYVVPAPAAGERTPDPGTATEPSQSAPEQAPEQAPK